MIASSTVGTDLRRRSSHRSLHFGCAAVLIGLLAGVAGAATTVFLDVVEHLTYHYSFGNMLHGRQWGR